MRKTSPAYPVFFLALDSQFSAVEAPRNPLWFRNRVHDAVQSDIVSGHAELNRLPVYHWFAFHIDVGLRNYVRKTVRVSPAVIFSSGFFVDSNGQIG